MKNVRVRALDGNGHPEATPPRHLTVRELLVSLESFAAEAAPLARRGQWLLHETALVLARIGRRRTRLRRKATVLHEEAEGLEAAAAARVRHPPRKARRPMQH